MSKEAQVKNLKWLSIIIFAVLIFQLDLKNTFAQAAKQEKCEKLAECLESFYKDCYDEAFLDSFSPKLIASVFLADSSEESEALYLDGLFREIAINTKSTGYIVVYGGRVNKYGEYDIRVQRITGYAFGTRRQDRNRIKFVHGGFREKFEFELWTSPIKNAFPPLSPTVAPEKVIFKGKMKPFSP